MCFFPQSESGCVCVEGVYTNGSRPPVSLECEGNKSIDKNNTVKSVNGVRGAGKTIPSENSMRLKGGDVTTKAGRRKVADAGLYFGFTRPARLLDTSEQRGPNKQTDCDTVCTFPHRGL